VITHGIPRHRALCLLVGRLCVLSVGLALWLPISLLWLPLVVCARSIATCKAQQAVRDSSVKIHGRDVTATWKLLISLLCVPVLWLMYTLLAGVVAHHLFHLPLVWQREAMLLSFFLLPVLTLIYIHASEHMLTLARSLLPITMILLRPVYAHQLAEQREALQRSVMALVDDDLQWRAAGSSFRQGGSALSNDDGAATARDGKGATHASEEWGAQWKASHEVSLGLPISSPGTSQPASLPESPYMTQTVAPADVMTEVVASSAACVGLPEAQRIDGGAQAAADAHTASAALMGPNSSARAGCSASSTCRASIIATAAGSRPSASAAPPLL